MISAGSVTRLFAASAFAGAAGAVLGAGIGAVIRNTGGAVAGAVLVLVIAPPLIVQLSSDASSWVPSTLTNVLSGIGDQVGVPGALFALAAWAIVPALIGLLAVERRDVI
jgi:hypothetical protein